MKKIAIFVSLTFFVLLSVFLVLSGPLDITPLSVTQLFTPDDGYGVSNYTKGGASATINFSLIMGVWDDVYGNITQITFELPSNVIFNDIQNLSNGTYVNSTGGDDWWCEGELGTTYYTNWSCYNGSESQLSSNDLIIVWFNFTVNNTGTEEPIVWPIHIYGNGSSQDMNTTYFSTNLDDLAPRIALNYPSNFYNETTGAGLEFNYTPTDPNIQTCELWGNWSGGWHLNETFLNPTSGALNGSTTLMIEPGRYVWSFYCNDTLSNKNVTTENYTVMIESAPSWSPIANIDRNEDFAQFTLDLSANISDILTEDTDLQVSYNVNNSNVSLSFDNSTNILTISSVANASDTANISLVLVDSVGLTSFESFDLVLSPVNDAPWWNPIADIEKNEDFAQFSLDLSANISDVEDSDTDLQISYMTNDSSIINITSLVNSTNIVTFDSLANTSGSVNITFVLVDSGGSSDMESFVLIVNAVNDAPDVPVLSSPANESSVAGYIPDFSWTNSSDIEGDAISYIIQIDDSPLFTEPVSYYNGSISETASPTSEVNASFGDGSYFWRVLATDGTANSSWSEVRYFTFVSDNTPPNVTLDAPANNGYDTDGVVIFNFTAIEDNPSTCQLYFRSNDTNWAENMSMSYSNNTQHNFTSVTLVDGVYVWGVRCNDTGSNYNFSDNWTLTVDSTAPTNPSVTPPTDTNIKPRTSITYSCSGTDVTSGINQLTWTLTKPDGTVITRLAGATGIDSETFSGDDTNLAGTYSLTCKLQDRAGLSTTSSVYNFEVHFSGGASSDSSSGGSSGSGGSKVILDEKTSEVTVQQEQGAVITFTLDGSNVHTITVKEITATTVTLIIQSEPKEITLKIGETKEVDVDDDGINDISVTLNGIKNGKADITTKKLPQPIKGEKVQKEGSEVSIPEITPSETKISEPQKRSNNFWIVLILIASFAIIGIAFYFLKLKK